MSMPSKRELEALSCEPVVAGSPLHRLIESHRKPHSDSAEWWQEVAQGLGIKIYELKQENAKLKEDIARLEFIVDEAQGR